MLVKSLTKDKSFQNLNQLISIVMRKLLFFFIILLLFQVDTQAAQYKYDLFGPLSYNDLYVDSTAIIIDKPLYVSDIKNTNNDGYWKYTVSDSNVRPIPEPATMFLLGTGLITLGWIGRKKIINGNRK